MRLLYKYTTIDSNSLNSLVNKYFYCSRPSQLNDPFDCYIKILHTEDDTTIQRWININRCPEYYDCRKKSFPFRTVQDVKKSYKDGRFNEYVYKIINQKDTNSFHIFCLSKSGTNPVLWYNYANSYNGMCIAYKAMDFSNNFEVYYGLNVKKMKFEHFRYFFESAKKYYFRIQDVKYSDSPVCTYNCMEHIFSSEINDLPGEFIWQAFHCKQKIWEYEEECRGIFTDNNLIEFDNKLYYEDEVLDSITFGYNASENAIDNVMKIVRAYYNNSHKIRFYKIIIDNFDKKLIRVPL